MIRPTHWTLCILVLTLSASAQDRSVTVSSRLLEILKQKGTISSAEFDELKVLEASMAEEQGLEAKLDTQVQEMVASIGRDPAVSYTPGKGFNFSLDGGRHKITMGGRLQVRFTQSLPDHAENLPNFTTPRVRIWWTGNAFSKDIKFKFQMDLGGDEAEGISVQDSSGSTIGTGGKARNTLSELKDAYVDWTPYKEFRIRGGQFKTPYSRHFITSAGSEQFIDRSPANNAFVPGRQAGIMVFGDIGSDSNEKLFQYFLGVFDGEGEDVRNDDTGLMTVGRVAINPLGVFKLTDSDLRMGEEREKTLLSIGVNAWYHSDDNRKDPDDPDSYGIGFDVAFKSHGVFLLAELHYRKTDLKGGSEAAGGFVVGGYSFLVSEDPRPEFFEISGRVTHIDYDNQSRTYTDEYLVGLGYFWQAHNMRLQLDFGRVEFHKKTSEDDEWVLRIQYQVVF